MKKGKRILASLLAALLVMGMLSACGSKKGGNTGKGDSEEGKKIMFINVMRSLEYFQNIEAEVKKTAEEKGYTVESLDVNCDYELTAEYITQAVQQQYDAVMICGDESLISSAEEAMDAGLAVVNYDAWIGSDNLSACVASDNKAMGMQMGEYAVELLKEKYGEVKGTVLYMNYTYSTIADRAEGFVSAFKDYPDVKLVEVIPTDPDSIDESATSAENTLTAYPENTIDIFFGPNSGTALGILSATESAKRTDVKVLGIDDEEGQISALQDADSEYYATIAQDPFAIGKSCVDCLEEIFAGKKGMKISVDSVLVTKENVAEYIANREEILKELKDWK